MKNKYDIQAWCVRLVLTSLLLGVSFVSNAETELDNGQTIIVSGTRFQPAFLKFVVPEGATSYRVSTSGGIGDADLYVRKGRRPTVNSFTCRSNGVGSTETCSASSPAPGTYFIMLRIFRNPFQNVSVTLNVTGGQSTKPPVRPTNTPQLFNGRPIFIAAQRGQGQGEEQFFKFILPRGVSSYSVSTSGGSGDVDLYVRKGRLPSSRNYDCRSTKSGNAEVCSASSPSSGTYYIMIKGYNRFQNVSLSLRIFKDSGSATMPLVNNKSVFVSGNKDEEKFFAFTLPNTARSYNVSISGGSGDVDLYVRKGRRPNLTNFDCRPLVFGNRESCSENAPAGGTYFVMLRGYKRFNSVSLRLRFN